MTEHHAESAWRDPLSLGWQAHRGLLLLRLRWHSSAERRRMTDDRAQPAPALQRIVRPRLRHTTSQ